MRLDAYSPDAGGNRAEQGAPAERVEAPRTLDWRRSTTTYPSGSVEITEKAQITKGISVSVSSWDMNLWTPGSAILAHSDWWVPKRIARIRAVKRSIAVCKKAVIEYENAIAVLVPELLRLKAEEGEQCPTE